MKRRIAELEAALSPPAKRPRIMFHFPAECKDIWDDWIAEHRRELAELVYERMKTDPGRSHYFVRVDEGPGGNLQATCTASVS